MGKSFSKFDGNDKQREREKEKERRNSRQKRRIVFEKPAPHQDKKSDKKDYTY